VTPARRRSAVRPEHLEALLARMRPHERLADARDAALLIIGWKEAIAGGVAGREPWRRSASGRLVLVDEPAEDRRSSPIRRHQPLSGSRTRPWPLICGFRPVGMRGHAQDVHVAVADLEHEQDVEPTQRHRAVDVKEIYGQEDVESAEARNRPGRPSIRLRR